MHALLLLLKLKKTTIVLGWEESLHIITQNAGDSTVHTLACSNILVVPLLKMFKTMCRPSGTNWCHSGMSPFKRSGWNGWAIWQDKIHQHTLDSYPHIIQQWNSFPIATLSLSSLGSPNCSLLTI